MELQNDQEVNIYALINPINNSVFYIGCTHCPWVRLNQHISQSRKDNTQKSIIIQEIKKARYDIEMLILDKCQVDNASFWEEFYIELFKSYGFDLKQAPISTYTDHHIGKRFLQKSNTNLIISKAVTEPIRTLAAEMGVYHEFLLKCALKEFVDKYKDATREMRDKLISDHPYFKPYRT